VRVIRKEMLDGEERLDEGCKGRGRVIGRSGRGRETGGQVKKEG
jgi:hypothetical protein